MKNQYVGDIGDYGKYGMLRYFSNKGIRIGVNWYLTEDDGSNDGKFISYLSKEGERKYDEELYDFLKEIIEKEEKSVYMVEQGNLLSGAVYFNEKLEKTNRENWHKKALETLGTAQLIFCDPDNGPLGKKSIKSAGAEKYISPNEIADYYKRGQNIVYYCQKARRTYEQWESTKAEMLQLLPDAKLAVLTYHRGTQRSYIFVIHPNDYQRYINIIYAFLRTDWGEIFTEEYINGRNAPNITKE